MLWWFCILDFFLQSRQLQESQPDIAMCIWYDLLELFTAVLFMLYLLDSILASCDVIAKQGLQRL